MNVRQSLLACSVILGLASPGEGSEKLRGEIGKLAKSVVDTVGDKGSVKVGIFSLKTAGLADINSGPGIEQVLAQELESQRKGIVQANAPYEINGDYTFAKAATGATTKVIKIFARVCNAETSETINELKLSPIAIDDNKTIAEILQTTGSLPPNGSYEERNKKIEEIARDPNAFVHGPNKTLISSSEKSQYDVEIRVRPQAAYNSGKGSAEPRPADVQKGQAFVKIEQHEMYEVHVRNRAGREVAVAVTIDGIDMFHFCQDPKPGGGAPAYSHWIMGAGSETKPTTLAVPGWFNTAKDPEKTYLAFLVVTHGKGAVSEAGVKARGQVGVIRVGIYECYELKPGSAPRSGDETGKGPPIGGKVKVVPYGVGAELDAVSVRYTREQK